MSIQYKRVAAGLYTDAKIAKLGVQPAHPTSLMLWLLTGPVFGIVPGCASVGKYGMAEQSGWSPDEIDYMITPLIESGIVQFDSAAPFLYLPRAVKYNEPKSPSNVVSWQSDWRKLPNCVLKERAWHTLRSHCIYRDKDVVFDKKKVQNSRTSFESAFEVIEKPPETDITPHDHRCLDSGDHRCFSKDDLNNNNNSNNNRDIGPDSPDLKDPASNVTVIRKGVR